MLCDGWEVRVMGPGFKAVVTDAAEIRRDERRMVAYGVIWHN